jgi:eukaryotic translation initiation factor 2C
MLQVPCHRLSNPQIQYGQGFAVADANTGRWDLRSKRFLLGNSNAPFHFVFLISPDLVLRNNTVENYAHDFIAQINTTGVGRAVEGSRIYLQGTGQNELDSALKSASLLKTRPEVVILLLKAKSIPVYSTFKYLADCVYGLQSICMTEEKCLDARSVRTNRGNVIGSLRGTAQYMGNIAMKANLKKGGVNHATKLVQNVAKDTLVLGADVTHPSPGALPGAPSIAAVVGSLGGTGGKFVGEMSLQITDRKEVCFSFPQADLIANFSQMIQKLREMVLSRLIDWYKENKIIPLRILYYRDGVADTQYGDVKTQELKKIELA